MSEKSPVSKSFLYRTVIVLLGFICIIVLFQLPKFVVNSDTDQDIQVDSEPQIAQIDEKDANHTSLLPENVSKETDRLKKLLNNSESDENSVIFADSLGLIFVSNFAYDSAMKYYQTAFDISGSDIYLAKLADASFYAFRYNQNPEKKVKTGMVAKGFLEQLTEKYPDAVEARVKLAVVYVYTEQPPMRGIEALKEIISDFPEHSEAYINLGEFMLTVNKVDKAAEQFEAVLKFDPENIQANLYLVETYQSMGLTDKALKLLSKIKTFEIKDPYVLSLINKLEKELK